MSLFDVLKQQYIEIIDWVETETGVLAYQFPMQNREIPTGAQLTVRESQMAIFLNEGQLADVFEPGRYMLSTKTLPRLALLKRWDQHFRSPFKSDVFFFSTREQLDQKWGTATPITVRDKELGPIRLRAHGSYSFRIKNPKVFFQKVSGTTERYAVNELEGHLRSAILAAIAHYFASSQVAFVDMAANQLAFSAALKNAIAYAFHNYGLSLETFLVQGISLPEELQSYFDKAASMRLVGDVKKYFLFQAAETLGATPSSETLGPGVGSGLGDVLRQMFAEAPKTSSASSTVTEPSRAAPKGLLSGSDDAVAMLDRLHELFKKGVLTQAEFEAKKAELLKKIGGP